MPTMSTNARARAAREVAGPDSPSALALRLRLPLATAFSSPLAVDVAAPSMSSASPSSSGSPAASFLLSLRRGQTRKHYKQTSAKNTIKIQ